MTPTDPIRSELSPRACEAVLAALARLDEPEELEAAVARLARAEARLTSGGRKARASWAETAERRAVAIAVARRYHRAGDRLTSRGVPYRLLGLAYPKTEAAFRRLEVALLEARDSGLLTWDAIADGSRRVLAHGRFADLAAGRRWLADRFWLDLWREAPVQVQVWVEKAGIADQLTGHAHELGVDLYPARGFTGAGFVRAAVAAAAQDERPLVVLTGGDLDSSGLRAVEAIERRVRRDADQLGVEVEAVEPWAVTPALVEALGLPTRPPKESSHRREGDPDEAVELDAMSPAQLREALAAAADRWWPASEREAAREREGELRDQLDGEADDEAPER